jgi:5-methylcytosine-specific restriction endonuclease McrBC regulatory subunit McrC
MVDINPYTVLSLPLIDYIVDSAEAGIAALKKTVQIKNQLPVKISFQQESQHLIKGTIEKIENKSSPGNNQVELIESKSNKDDIQTYLEYLLSNEALSTYLLREFFLKWKPLIDGCCIDLNRLINVV